MKNPIDYIVHMTTKQLQEVDEAVNEMYTLRDIYWKVANMDWTEEMFFMFFKRTMDKARKAKC